MSMRPNILFALADDCSHFGIYGHTWIHTPYIDRIAQNGVLFENAYTCNPKCAPSRACILTGRYTWELEDACNHFSYFPKNLTLLPDLLDNEGYFTGYTGKGWEPGDWKRSGLKRNPAGNEFNKYTTPRPKNTSLALCDYSRNFEDFLSRKPSDKPFFFWYGGREPHRPYTYGEGLRAGRSVSEIPCLPSYWPDCEEVRTDILDYAYETEYFDLQLGRMLDTLEKKHLLDNTLIIVTSDNGCAFPRVKGQMYEQDFHLPMVAQWPSKTTKKGRRICDFVSFPDLAPTILQAAGLPIPSCMSGKSFSDIFETDAEGQIHAERNVAYFGREKHDPGRQGENGACDVGYPVRCIRTEQYLYIRNFAPNRWPAGNPETLLPNCDYSPTKQKIITLKENGNDHYWTLAFGKRPPEEFYNIQQDPECITNLAFHKAYRPIMDSMWTQLETFLKKTEDPRLTDPDYFDRMPSLWDGAACTWKAYEEGKWEPADFLTDKWQMAKNW